MKPNTHSPFLFIVPFVLLCLIGAAPAKDYVNVDRNGIGIQGYDPVAYFTEKSAVEGSKDNAASYKGVTYLFASEANKAAFAKDPEKYVPQFGGFCAWAVSQGYTAKIDPEAFQIVDGRLLLQYSPKIRDRFNQDTKGNLEQADANWPGLVEEKGE